MLQFITKGFIDFFGITKPSATQERQAAWFITALLLGVVVFAAAVFGLVVLLFGR